MDKEDERNKGEKSIDYRCPQCGGTVLRDGEHAEIVCENCGFVIYSKIADRGPEWRAYNLKQRQRRARTGAPTTYTIHDKGLSTAIDRRNRDASGKSLPPERRWQMYRLRRWQRRIRVSGSHERSLSIALSAMSKVAGALNLPKNVLETGSVVYRKALKKNLIRGREMKTLTAAALYVACRQCKIARSIHELAEASGSETKDLGRAYRHLVKELNIYVPPPKTRGYISKFASKLYMQGKVEKVAHKILTEAKRLRLSSGRGPAGLAAAALYIASTIAGERRTQREIAEVAQMTEVTVRNRYKEMTEKLMMVVSL